MRLIDADALIAEYFKDCEAYLKKVCDRDICGTVLMLAEAPTIDPERLRPQGEWLKSEDDYCGLNIIKCSLCREEWCFEVGDDAEALNYHYCPNCGAKMKGGNT